MSIKYSLYHEECNSLDEVPEGAIVEAINGRKVIDKCCVCGSYIVSGDDFSFASINKLVCCLCSGKSLI